MSLRRFLKQMEMKGEILHVENKASTRFEVQFIMKKYDNKGQDCVYQGKLPSGSEQTKTLV
jgi:UbiD family decarboxylase